LFWKRQQIFFPVLYSIARQILIIPATNTAVERLFSASGNTVTHTRTRLSAEKVDKLMFIKKNLLILKKIFIKDEKLNNINTHTDGDATVTITRAEKRSHDDDDDADDEDNGNDMIFTNANTT
jgi:hypothetical protein